MTFLLADRVQETGTANTTVSFTLSGAMTSYQSFGAIGTGNTTYYGATDGTNWEVGLGTYTTSPNTLTRTTILSSSNSGSAVTFSGTVTVWCDYPAGKQISSDYPNALGVVTPAAGTFTTITGQTEVLKGTGNNLLLQSQTFSNASWNKYGSSITANTVTAPDSTLTGSTLTSDGTSTSHRIDQATANSMVAGYPKTVSIYAQKGTNNFLQIYFNGDVAPFANFDLNAGTVGSVGTNQTATITNAGGGWYRCVCYTSSTTATNPGFCLIAATTDGRVPTNTLATTVYLWGAQGEIGSTANTYVPTTTTAVYGTPTLSFSGVAGLGLQSDGSLYVSPAGTGALQAQATTSSTVGGNARGANAVDWQTYRTSANSVASAQYSVIAGGGNNQASGFGGFIGGGFGNAVITGNYNTVSGGGSNTAGQYNSTVAGGQFNSASGYMNFIGGGYTNSGTSASAVTTQTAASNGVTSGSTAVTLSGSNANIKVGQLITGTGIVSYTYVAAISGTSLTLSQNANATGTPTLSFYTPHGVVVGGGNNQATGSYSFIGGGGDAGTAANRNVASGDWSFVGGGIANQATGLGAVIGGGGIGGLSSLSGNTASGNASFIGGGSSNQATAQGGQVLAGVSNIANGSFSTVLGYQGTARSIAQAFVFSTARLSSGGDSQTGLYVERVQTTDATPTVLTTNGNAASTTNQVILPNNSAYYFKVSVIANVTGGGNTKAWTLEGAIKRGSGVGTAAIVGTVTTTIVAADLGAATWAVTATADTVNGGLAITFTGQASTTIRTVARVDTTEVTF